MGETPLRYDFEAVKGSEVCHYNRLGVLEAGGMDAPFVITPGFHVPEWAKGALMYQIFVDRFNNGDPTNDVLGDEYVYIGFPVTKVENGMIGFRFSMWTGFTAVIFRGSGIS